MKGRMFKVVATALLWMLGHAAYAGTVTYVYTDPQGTPLAEADASGNITATFDYRPYGAQALGSPNDGLGYTGHTKDLESGFVYMQARFYDPGEGLFLSPDPLKPSAGNIFSFNRYLYAAGNPILNVDPTGKACGTTSDVSAGVQRMRNAADNCGAASAVVVRAFNSGHKAYYVYADGAVVQKSGTRPGRDNNPGDLRRGGARAISTLRAAGWDFSKTSADDRVTEKLPFAMFSTMEVGEKALGDTLNSVYGSRSIAQAVESYAPASDQNNPGQYAAYLSRSTGFDTSRTIRSLSPTELQGLVHAISAMEGVKNTQSTILYDGLGPFSSQ